METQEKILKFAKDHRIFKVADFIKAEKNQYSRQYISKLVNELVVQNKLMKHGVTAGSEYALPGGSVFGDEAMMTIKNDHLEEHKVLEKIESQAPFVLKLPDNVRSIFDYAFSEMLNNAIEHSHSERIGIQVMKRNQYLIFEIRDFGIGVFRNIKQKRKLESELEAMQDLLKGKTTTAPQAHSGEGIFFTSKIADRFRLRSYDYTLDIDNRLDDIYFGNNERSIKGTEVTFEISLDSKKHLINIFQQFQTDNEEMAFDKTEIKVQLFTLGTVHISRSQARRILADLDKFKSIILDFDKVPMVGQAFADEIFRVFKNKHPEITITPTNMNDAVDFMIKRVGK